MLDPVARVDGQGAVVTDERYLGAYLPSRQQQEGDQGLVVVQPPARWV
jgi:hypothetical protein